MAKNGQQLQWYKSSPHGHKVMIAIWLSSIKPEGLCCCYLGMGSSWARLEAIRSLKSDKSKRGQIKLEQSQKGDDQETGICWTRLCIHSTWTEQQTGMIGNVWICLYLFGFVYICLDLFRLCLDLLVFVCVFFVYVWICLDLFGYVWICL